MAEQQIVRIDKIKWWITTDVHGNRNAKPVCPQHNLRMNPVPPRHYNSVRRGYVNGYGSDGRSVICAEGPHQIDLSRKFSDEQQYVIDRIDAKVFAGMPVLNLDDEAIPLAKAKAKSADGKHFVTAQLMESKRGLQAVIYAGEKGSQHKTQIFVDPETKRMSFDHTDLHPTDVFLKIESTFADGSRSSIEK